MRCGRKAALADKLYDVQIRDDDQASYHWPVEADRDAFRQVRQSLRGHLCQIMLRKKPTKRSLRQNAYLHAEVFPKVGEWMGCSIPEAKLALMGECWGYVWHPKMGRYLPRKPATSEMSVKDATEFIEWVIPWAAQQGVDVNPPDNTYLDPEEGDD